MRNDSRGMHIDNDERWLEMEGPMETKSSGEVKHTNKSNVQFGLALLPS